MDIQATAQLLGNFGEFIGALAVVATLGYLAVQVRQNTRSVNTATIFTIVQEANSINLRIVENSHTAKLFELGQNSPDELTPEELTQAQMLIRTVINLAAAGFWSKAQQPVPDDIWDSLRGSARNVGATAGGRRLLEANRELFPAEFIDDLIPPDAPAKIFNRAGWDTLKE